MKNANPDGPRACLDRLGEEWGRTRAQGDEAVRMRLQNEIFDTLYKLYPSSEDAINTVFMQDWQRYDPRQGSLSAFFDARIPLRKKDADRRNQGKRLVVRTDAATGGKTKQWVRMVEQEPSGGEDSESPAQKAWTRARSGPEGEPEAAADLDEAACILLSSILRLPDLLEGRSNNPARRRYFQMFFTDGVAAYLHEAPVPNSFRRKERELFQAPRLPFLDYFMARECRTAAAIQASPLKPYGQLVEGRPMEEAELPLQADVYIAYLERVEHYKAGASAISNQRKDYNAFIKKCLF